MEKPSTDTMLLRNYFQAQTFIQKIDHILQSSVLTELLMEFLPLEEWVDSFMLTVEVETQIKLIIN